MAISFHKKDVEFDLPEETHLINWLMEVSQTEDKVVTELTYIFCTDDYLLSVNQEYLNHDYYTDIITFPYKQGKEIESDIFISVDRIRENAVTFESTFKQELLRVMVHGLLHLMGYNDHTARDKEEMRTMENRAIDLFKY